MTFVLNQRRASLEKLEGQIKSLPPAKAALSGESRMAWFLGKLGVQVSEADIQMGWPMMPPMVLEFLAAFFGVVGLRRETGAPVASAKETVSKPETEPDLEALRTFFAAGDGPVTNDQLAERLGVSKGQASKLTTKAVKTGLLQRERLGRNVSIRLN